MDTFSVLWVNVKTSAWILIKGRIPVEKKIDVSAIKWRPLGKLPYKLSILKPFCHVFMCIHIDIHEHKKTCPHYVIGLILNASDLHSFICKICLLEKKCAVGIRSAEEICLHFVSNQFPQCPYCYIGITYWCSKHSCYVNIMLFPHVNSERQKKTFITLQSTMNLCSQFKVLWKLLMSIFASESTWTKTCFRKGIFRHLSI